MNSESKIIVITGAESTGKSVLTQWLANHFQALFIPEYARDYIEKLERKYLYSDVEFIARKQVQQLNELQKTNPPLIFSDTWLINTKIWFEEVFGRKPEWLEREIMKTKIDLFVVCDTDLPWIQDPVRENGGEKRLYLQKRYIETIKKYEFNYKIVRGKDESRYACALKHIKNLI
jgi:NadR type nicotinamide-nucleotide adenylyltransferase